MTEEEVKLNYITPAIEEAGWSKKQIRMEYSITAGKIVVRGNVAKRLPVNAPRGIINQALMKISLYNETISDYFEIILYDALHKLSEKSKGTAIKNIAPFEILKPAKVQIPPLNEQKRILNKLAMINQIISS